MKKLAIGCGVVVLLLAVAAAVGSYLAYRKVSTTFSDFAERFRISSGRFAISLLSRLHPQVS